MKTGGFGPHQPNGGQHASHYPRRAWLHNLRRRLHLRGVPVMKPQALREKIANTKPGDQFLIVRDFHNWHKLPKDLRDEIASLCNRELLRVFQPRGSVKPTEQNHFRGTFNLIGVRMKGKPYEHA